MYKLRQGLSDALQRNEVVRVELDKLDSVTRQALLAKVWHGLKYAEIAKLLGLSHGEVAKRIHVGTRRILDILYEKEHECETSNRGSQRPQDAPGQRMQSSGAR